MNPNQITVTQTKQIEGIQLLTKDFTKEQYVSQRARSIGSQ